VILHFISSPSPQARSPHGRLPNLVAMSPTRNQSISPPPENFNKTRSLKVSPNYWIVLRAGTSAAALHGRKPQPSGVRVICHLVVVPPQRCLTDVDCLRKMATCIVFFFYSFCYSIYSPASNDCLIRNQRQSSTLPCHPPPRVSVPDPSLTPVPPPQSHGGCPPRPSSPSRSSIPQGS